MFVNPEIPLESLPVAAELDWQPLHPHFVRRLQTSVLIRNTVLAGMGAGIHYGVATRDLGTAIAANAPWLPLVAWAVFAVLSLGALAWPVISVRRRGYAVRDHDIVYKSGVLWRSVRTVPFNRVQHTQTDSTPLDRRFGLANLAIFPAGAGGHKIRGLGEGTAEQLRAHVSARIGADAGEATDDGC